MGHVGRQALCQVKNGISKQKKTVMFCMLWIVFGIYKAIMGQLRFYEFYQIDISMADILLLLQNYRDFGMILLTVIVFGVMRCKLDSLNTQFTIRHAGRRSVLYRQFLESAIYAAGISAFLAATELVIAVLLKVPVINWDSPDSIYFFQTNQLLSENIFFVCVGVYVMNVLKILMILALLDILLWSPKWIFVIWIIILLMAGLEFITTAEFKGFFSSFSIQYEMWQYVEIQIMEKIHIGCVSDLDSVSDVSEWCGRVLQSDRTGMCHFHRGLSG